MKKTAIFMSLAAAVVFALPVQAEVNQVTPSTNDENRDKGWAHVNQLVKGIGTTKLEFVSTRNFLSCFEYRTDGDTSQVIDSNNFNPAVTDGLYLSQCVSNSTYTIDLSADYYVEIRMVFGAESDERFDWTRFDVVYPVSGQITYPAADGDHVSGLITLAAEYDDGDDLNDDAVQWAVRKGTCSAGTNTVFGNVDGKTDDYDWDGKNFTADINTTGLEYGETYCFIFNPTDDPGQSNIRLTRLFVIDQPHVGPPISADECKNGAWADFNNPEFKNQGDCVSYVKSSPKAVGNKTK